jgi:hypothetical protein
MDLEGSGEDFQAFCAIVEAVQDGILQEWNKENRQQAEPDPISIW